MFHLLNIVCILTYLSLYEIALLMGNDAFYLAYNFLSLLAFILLCMHVGFLVHENTLKQSYIPKCSPYLPICGKTCHLSKLCIFLWTLDSWYYCMCLCLFFGSRFRIVVVHTKRACTQVWASNMWFFKSARVVGCFSS
jgi:hypothetical protein